MPGVPLRILRPASTVVMMLVAAGIPGCATIGPAVPKLSSSIGERIAEMRSLHEFALRKLFDGERARVDAFMDERWTPTFLQNYIGSSDIVATVSARSTVDPDVEARLSEALKSYLSDPDEAIPAARAVVAVVERGRTGEPESIGKELDRFVPDAKLGAAAVHVTALLSQSDPARELMEWARQAEIQIRAQRTALHAPIDEAEQRVMNELAATYDDLIGAQGKLTARVQAAARLKEIQDDALATTGLKQGFEKAREQALKVGAGVGGALAGLDKLAKDGRLHGTDIDALLRAALRDSLAAPLPANPN